MLAKLGRWFLKGYIGWQLAALAVWIGIEASGYGFGVLDALFRRPLTNADGTRPLDIFTGGAPPGPVRLSRDQETALGARLKATFGDQVPKHTTFADMAGVFYTLQPGSLCDWRRGSNIASDPKECNRLKSATPFFVAVLRHSHPKIQHMIWREAPAASGGYVLAGFFVGTNGKPKILFDVSRIGAGKWDVAQGFEMLVHHGGGTGSTDIALGEPLDGGPGLYLIDDPGAFPRRDARCDQPACFARIHLYGILGDGTRDSMGRRVRRNLADLALDADLERRAAFYAVLLGKTVPMEPAKAAIETKFKVTDFGVTKYELVHLEGKFEQAMGAGTFARATFAPVGFRVAFGTVYGIRFEDKFYTLWDVAISSARLGTDRMLFRLGDSGAPIEGVRSARELNVIPYPGSLLPKSGTRMTANKATAPNGTAAGRSWSEFEHFDRLFAPLSAK